MAPKGPLTGSHDLGADDSRDPNAEADRLAQQVSSELTEALELVRREVTRKPDALIGTDFILDALR